MSAQDDPLTLINDTVDNVGQAFAGFADAKVCHGREDL